jgi:hypothetical protein
MSKGNQTATFNDYIALVTQQPSAYSDVRVLPIIGKYIVTINFYLDKNSSKDDLQSIKQILSTFTSLD